MKRFFTLVLAFALLVTALAALDGSALASSVGADGHTHNWRDIGRTMQPTCTEYGYRTEECTICWQVRQVPLNPLGHYFPNPWKTISEPSCTEAGHEMNTCVRVNRGKECGYEWWREIPALGHDWDEGKVTKAPTATLDGEMTYTCRRDPSHTKTEPIPATGEDGGLNPALYLKVTWDENAGEGKRYEGALIPNYYTVTNTGDCTVYIEYDYPAEATTSFPRGAAFVPEIGESRIAIHPSESWYYTYLYPVSKDEVAAGCIDYNHEGVVVDGGEWIDTDGTVKYVGSNNGVIYIPLTYPEGEGPHPELTLSASWADDAGVGKRYEGAEVDVSFTMTNTGDCPVEWYYNNPRIVSCAGSGGTLAPNVKIEMQPGEYETYVYRYAMPLNDVEAGFLDAAQAGWGWYTDQEGNRHIVYSNTIYEEIPLTYPGGEEPEEAKPGLTLKWDYDRIWHNESLTVTTEPGVLSPEDGAYACVFPQNTGNVPLYVETRGYFGNGTKGGSRGFGVLSPGEKGETLGFGSYPITDRLTPGTETEDLLGTVTFTIWAIGYDPETREELCKSNEIIRTWKVGKDAEPEDLGDSLLSGKLEVRSGCEPSDPAGYQLGEPVSTVLTVENVGPIDLESFTVSDPWDDTAFSDGPIAVSGTKSYVRADVTVTEDDVEKGYIEFPMITIKWTDPDTGKERTTLAGPLTVPVLKKTGLLLKKGYEDPKNGEYFAEGEQIAWTLSVTNNSKESITDVKVDDQGVTVGEYAELKPNDKENCAVPKHTVTEYEAKVVGYVLNSATATGTDYRGVTKTWPSNVAKAITKKPTDPGEDPKGDPYGLHPAVSIVKAEDPAGPANGSYYEANEAIKYTITVKNVGDTELKDIAVTDSLAGFAPIGTLTSLAPNEEKTFDYAYTVKEEDIPYQWIYNSATVIYTFGDGVKGTPKTSNTVQSRVGDDPFPPELPHLDPGKLPEGDDWCRLTLESLSENEARYTLHACAAHAEAAMAAEEAAANGDWKAAAAIWEAEVEELCEILYNAADSQLKGALVTERAVFCDYLDSINPLTVDETVRSMRANVDSLYDLLLAAADKAKTAELLAEKEKLYADIDASYGGSEYEARANALRLKCAFLCCALHTVPNALPSSLAGDYAQMMGSMEATETTRVFGALDGTDSEVIETYAGAALKAQSDVIDLLSSAKSYNADDVFARGQQLWQVALDNEVNPVYEAADKEQRTLIALWRIALDSLSAAEKPFLELLYAGNDNAIEETLMNLYKDAALTAAGFGNS